MVGEVDGDRSAQPPLAAQQPRPAQQPGAALGAPAGLSRAGS
ncbi:hypothetical protein [Micromonospora sp. NPDC048830]